MFVFDKHQVASIMHLEPEFIFFSRKKKVDMQNSLGTVSVFGEGASMA